MVQIAHKGEKHIIYRVYRNMWGNDCYRLKGSQWGWTNSMLIPAKNNTAHNRRIIIEVSDTGANAKYIDGKAVLKEASVKRYYKDEPNDYNAACAVLAKLFPDDAKTKITAEEPKYYSGKVVCIASDDMAVFKVGKVYEFVNGQADTDNGRIFPKKELRQTTLGGINWIVSGLKFIELVED